MAPEHEVVLLVTVPAGSPAVDDPDTLPGWLPTEIGMVVLVSDHVTVFVLTLLIPSDIVQYMVPDDVIFALTLPVTPVVAELGFVRVADPLAIYQV